MNKTLLHLIGPKESRTDFALRIYDTAVPPVSMYRAAKLAGISPVTLRSRLVARERFERTRCPQCGRFPGQRNWRVKPGPKPRPISSATAPTPAERPRTPPQPR